MTLTLNYDDFSMRDLEQVYKIFYEFTDADSPVTVQIANIDDALKIQFTLEEDL